MSSYQTWEIPTSAPGAPSEECSLVVRARAGNQAAFEALYERYNTPLCRYLIRMVGNDGIGCELTQETFLKAWEALPGLRDPERFASWLYRIATNCAYTYQHHAKHLHLVSWDVHEGGLEELSVAGPEQQVADTELLKLALSRVSATYRPCLILYVVEDLPQRKIADLLKIKESSVSKYVSRGKEELRQIYHRLLKEQRVPARGER
jgi:RNA polymerase sigma-70 factor (ECF subfamily)